MKRILSCVLAAGAVIAVAIGSADAAARKHHPGGYYQATADAHYWRFGDRPVRPWVRRSIDGDPIDRHGWRLRNGNWDNTCFRTLDYLSSMSACSGGGAG